MPKPLSQLLSRSSLSRVTLASLFVMMTACSDGEGDSPNTASLSGHLTGTIDIDALIDNAGSELSAFLQQLDGADGSSGQTADETADEIVNLIRSTAANCDVSDIVNCVNGEIDQLSSTPIQDTAVKSDQPAYVTMDVPSTGQRSEISLHTSGERTGHQLVVMDNQLMMLGGKLNGQMTNDVMRTQNDGMSWTSASDDSSRYSERFEHRAVVHHEAVFISGGTDGESEHTDVWYSPDGDAWERRAAEAFPSRSRHAMVSHASKIWVFGGARTVEGEILRLNDIWVSEDEGENWTQITPEGNHWAARSDFAYTVHFGKIWIMGGIGENGEFFNDLWTTSDGKNWTQIIPAIDLGKRAFHSLISLGTHLYIIGGQGESEEGEPKFYRNDVLGSSNNGIGWQVIQKNWSDIEAVFGKSKTTHGTFSPRANQKFVAHGSHVDMVGGEHDRAVIGDSIWRGFEGLTFWQKVSPQNAVFDPMADHDMLKINDWLIILGGMGADSHQMDMQISSDGGKHWHTYHPAEEDSEKNLSAPTPRAGHLSVVFLGNIYLIGGQSELGSEAITQVLMSEDFGQTFADISSELTADSDGESFDPSEEFGRIGRAAVVHGDNLVMSGGTDKDGVVYSDIFLTLDGKKWKKLTPACTTNPELPTQTCNFQLHDHQIVSYNDKMYMVGGYDENNEPVAQVLESATGETWMPILIEGLSPVANHQLVVYLDYFVLIGGDHIDEPGDPVETTNTIRLSHDSGKTWAKAEMTSDSAPFAGRKMFRTAVTDDAIVATGGMNEDGKLLNEIYHLAIVTDDDDTAASHGAPKIGIRRLTSWQFPLCENTIVAETNTLPCKIAPRRAFAFE